MEHHSPSSLKVSGQNRIMLLIFLLTLSGSDGSPGARAEMLCTPSACLILHMEPVNFGKAKNRCEDDGGYLMTLRDRREEEDLRSLLALVKPHQTLRLWIGLKLKKKDCMRSDETLRGFKWVSGEEDSQYANWKPEPALTCTERCVTVDHSVSGNNSLNWTAGSCKKEAFYACKFYFQGMCGALTLLGPGRVVYEAVFSRRPLKSELTLLPFGTRARIFCGGHESDSSLCNKLDGAYIWTRPGPFCQPEARSCGKHNGGCEQECRQEGDGVRCSCREGYELDEDGFSCRTDRCRPGTCQHGCVTDEDGFSCTCPSGFRLSENQRDCSDVDECLSQACGEHGCRNTLGGYACVCAEGFRLAHGECADVDECERSPCEHHCVNNVGSFSCFCYRGFDASGDGRSCQDVDECVADPCPPDLACINTDGSFACVKPGAPETPTSTTPPDHRRTPLLESPHTDAPRTRPVNATDGERRANQSSVSAEATSVRSSVIVCVLGAVVPLLLVIALTLFIVAFRCRRSKQEVKKKKKGTADGYCWVSSGLDPRLEKLYESILTDDL